MKLKELNQELSSINKVKKTMNELNRWKNAPFENYKHFWRFTENSKTQEEFTQLMNQGIEEGIKTIKKLVIDLREKFEKEEPK